MQNAICKKGGGNGSVSWILQRPWLMETVRLQDATSKGCPGLHIWLANRCREKFRDHWDIFIGQTCKYCMSYLLTFHLPTLSHVATTRWMGNVAQVRQVNRYMPYFSVIICFVSFLDSLHEPGATVQCWLEIVMASLEFLSVSLIIIMIAVQFCICCLSN